MLYMAVQSRYGSAELGSSHLFAAMNGIHVIDTGYCLYPQNIKKALPEGKFIKKMQRCGNADAYFIGDYPAALK